MDSRGRSRVGLGANADLVRHKSSNMEGILGKRRCRKVTPSKPPATEAQSPRGVESHPPSRPGRVRAMVAHFAWPATVTVRSHVGSASYAISPNGRELKQVDARPSRGQCKTPSRHMGTDSPQHNKRTHAAGICSN